MLGVQEQIEMAMSQEIDRLSEIIYKQQRLLLLWEPIVLEARGLNKESAYDRKLRNITDNITRSFGSRSPLSQNPESPRNDIIDDDHSGAETRADLIRKYQQAAGSGIYMADDSLATSSRPRNQDSTATTLEASFDNNINKSFESFTFESSPVSSSNSSALPILKDDFGRAKRRYDRAPDVVKTPFREILSMFESDSELTPIQCNNNAESPMISDVDQIQFELMREIDAILSCSSHLSSRGVQSRQQDGRRDDIGHDSTRARRFSTCFGSTKAWND